MSFALVTLVTLCTSGPGGGVASAAAPAPKKQQQQHEIHYLELVADHHAMGVMMAQMCEEKAVSPELRDLCARAAADQAMEVEMVLSWLEDWYGIEYEPDVRGMGRMNRLQRLEGPAFDVEFSEEFIKHHRQIIRASAQELGFLYHPEAEALAMHIIEEQSADIEELRAVIESYGEKAPPGLDVPNLPKSR
jgi:uncharacterized protein (DUF305 family)